MRPDKSWASLKAEISSCPYCTYCSRCQCAGGMLTLRKKRTHLIINIQNEILHMPLLDLLYTQRVRNKGTFLNLDGHCRSQLSALIDFLLDGSVNDHPL